jgi:hypothetical protein
MSAAEVSLTPLHSWSNPKSWINQDWSAVDAATVRQQTDEAGRFSLCVEASEAEALRAHGAALWVTGRGAAPLLRIADAVDLAEPLVLEMSSAPDAFARVEDESAASGVRATIQLRGFRRAVDIGMGEERSAHAHRIFHRSYEIALGELVAIPPTDFHLASYAESGGRRSEPQFGPLQGERTYRLGPVFEARGSVLAPCSPETLKGARVFVGRRADAADAPPLWYGRSTVREDGSFGPDSWPHSTTRPHVFRLEGEHIVAQVIERDLSARDSDVWLDFDCEIARIIPVLVKNATGATIASARVRAIWQRGEGEPMIRGVENLTDEQGRGSLVCPERLPIWISAWHPDYSDYSDGPLTVPPGPDSVVEIVLASPMTIEGRVLASGKPAADFEIVHWQGDPFDMKNEAFRGVPDGAFKLENLPSAQTTLYATIQGRPPSATVALDPSSNAPLVLEVGEGVSGRGRIVDGATREPIPGSSAQVYSAFEYQLLTPIGPEVATDAQGAFLVSGLNPERAPVLARAPGYDWVVAWGGAIPGGIDFGTIVMWKGREVRLQLRSAEPIDFSLCSLALRGSKSASAIPFDASGLARFEVASPGWLQFTVATPHGHSEEFTRTLPAAASSWDFELELGGSAQATLDLRAVGDCELPAQGDLRLALRTQSGMEIARSLRWNGAREQRLERLWPGPARLELRAAGRSLLVAELVIAPGEENAFELELPCERPRLQLLHANREPVRAARVLLMPAGGAWASWANAVELVSAADGMLEPPALPSAELVLAIFGEATHVGVPLRLERAPAEGVQRLVLGPEGELRLVLRDGAQLLEGVHLALMEARLDYQLAIATTGEDGSATWSRLAAGGYTWEASGAGVWFTRGAVQLGAGGTSTHELEVRRTGNARLRVLDAAGAPVPGIALELRSQELSESTADWLASGHLASSASSPVTDTQGQAHFEGIPRGNYQWTASDASGPRASGALVVQPGETLEQNLVLP